MGPKQKNEPGGTRAPDLQVERDPASSPAEHHMVGPAALKGLAHPLRVQLLTALNDRGSATASQLAAALGESSGSTSYHLRQLHRHGFVEEDPDAGTGRERYWIPRRGGWDLPVFDLLEDTANVAAIDLVLREQLLADQRRQLTAIAQAPHWPAKWRDAMTRHDAVISLNADQTLQLIEELEAVIRRYQKLPAGPGARRVALLLSTLPTEHEVEK
jgi:DNA-binding transcriptional ArsR family regulator